MRKFDKKFVVLGGIVVIIIISFLFSEQTTQSYGNFTTKSISQLASVMIYGDTFNELERQGTNGADKWIFDQSNNNNLLIVNQHYQWDKGDAAQRHLITPRLSYPLPEDFKISIDMWQKVDRGSGMGRRFWVTNGDFSTATRFLHLGFDGSGGFDPYIYFDGQRIYGSGVGTLPGERDGTDGIWHNYAIEKIGTTINFYRDGLNIGTYSDNRIDSTTWNYVVVSDLYNQVIWFDNFIVEDLNPTTTTTSAGEPCSSDFNCPSGYFCYRPDPYQAGNCLPIPTTTQPCLQILTPAYNPITQECQTFPSTCLSEGWIAGECPYATTTSTTTTQPLPPCASDTECPQGYFCNRNPYEPAGFCQIISTTTTTIAPPGEPGANIFLWIILLIIIALIYIFRKNIKKMLS